MRRRRKKKKIVIIIIRKRAHVVSCAGGDCEALSLAPIQRFRTGVNEERRLQWLTQGADQDMQN